MSNRRILNCALGALVGLLLASGARGAGAQAAPPKSVKDTAKKPVVSDQRMKIGKETKPIVKVQGAAGEVRLPPCPVDQDSVDRAIAAVRREQFDREQLARDSQRRLDSIQSAARARDAVDRERAIAAAQRQNYFRDSVAFAKKAADEAALARQRHLARGFYLGLAAGASAPQRDTRNGYTGGWNMTIPFGWDATDQPFGVRTDFSVDHMNGTRVHDLAGVTTSTSGDLTVWSLNADLKLRAHAPGGPTRSHVYALGGFGAHRVAEGVYGSTGPLAGQTLNFGDAKTSFGWNVGAGASLEWGPTELFVETRFFQVKSDLAYQLNGGVGTYTSFTPIVVGLQFF
jgi:opacity protein-like surface antigen